MTRRTGADGTGSRARVTEPRRPAARPTAVTAPGAVRAVATLGLLFLLAACAQRSDAGAAPDRSTGASTAQDADELVLQVRHTGGFLPVGMSLSDCHWSACTPTGG